MVAAAKASSGYEGYGIFPDPFSAYTSYSLTKPWPLALPLDSWTGLDGFGWYPIQSL